MEANSAKISCIGLPGSGKSTIGRQLSRRLGVRFLDSDQVIEQRAGCSVRELFEREGESAFRQMEREVIDELTREACGVISTGGGAVLDPGNRENLRNRTRVIYLHSAPEEVYRRLKHDHSRPLLQVSDPLAKLRDLYAARDALYRETAHFVIETGRPSIATLVNMILMQLELAGMAPAA